MINNRQNGRRRGRGGNAPRPNGSGGAPDRGNRLDNRARGNAAQLHEKYKTLARDAQMQGDRVNTEYYLQFADHYFRVLSESRARFDEQQQHQRPRRDDYQPQGDYQGQGDDQDDYDDEAEPHGGGNGAQAGNGNNGNYDERDGGGDRQPRFERQDRYERQDRPDRQAGQDRPERQDRQAGQDRPDRGQRVERQDRPERIPRFEQPIREQSAEQPREPRRGRPPRDAEAGNFDNRANGNEGRLPEFARPSEAPAVEAPQAERPRRGRPRRTEMAAPETTEERIEIDRLPPAFSTDAPLLAGVVEPEAVAEKPRRRTTRKPRGDTAIADI